jgi:photosystem II stability/assembly factor-like uncharacterized protein
VNNEPNLYETTDGGRTWRPTGLEAFGVVLSGGIGCASGPRGFLRTANGGATWQPFKPPTGAGCSDVLFPLWRAAISSFAAQDAHMVGASGRVAWLASYDALYSTTNRGHTWQTFTFPPALMTDGPVAFSFPSTDVGYFLTTSGQLFRTRDGGATWSLLY